MKDLEIYRFLKYEESQGRKHPYIEELWQKARQHKAAHRETMYQLTTLPKLKDQILVSDLKERAEAYQMVTENYYKHLKQKIEETLCTA